MIKWQWLRRWLPVLSGVIAAQLLVQLLNGVSGFLLVRTMAKEPYAWFTIVSSMMAVISLLADAGTGVAANAIGGPVWQDRFRFSQIIVAVLRYRKWLAALAATVALPWTAVLLVRAKVPLADLVITTAGIMLSAWPQTSAQILGSVNRLHSRYRAQQIADIVTAAARLGLTSACWGFGALTYVTATLSACFPSLVNYHLVRKQAATIVDFAAARTLEFDAQIKQTVRHVYPSTLFYCFQGQLSTWLMSLFGTTAQVADIGALGRLSVVFALVGAPLSQIAGPSFARCKERHLLLAQFWKVFGLLGLFGLVVLLFSIAAPGPILWILGPKYSHLTGELRLSVVGLIVSTYSGITWGLAMARGWVKLASLTIPLAIVSQVVGLALFDLSSVSGVLGFNIFTTIPSVLLAAFVIWQGFHHWKIGQLGSQPGELNPDAPVSPP